MTHEINIQKIKELIRHIKGIELAVVYGSYARKQQNPNSDLDIHLLSNDQFSNNELETGLADLFHGGILKMLSVSQKNKIVLYLSDAPKIEITINKEPSTLMRDLIGSEISDIDDCILFINENNDTVKQLCSELRTAKPLYQLTENRHNYTSELIDRFLYEFENCSSMHARGDGYRFYFFYNIALHSLVQLEALCHGTTSFNFLPKQLTAKILTEKEDQEEIYSLKGSIYLPDGNSKKRALLNRFYKLLNKLVSKEKNDEITEFCEEIFRRDAIWNFRDLSKNNRKIRKGVVFRSAMLVPYQYSDELNELLEENKVTTIIDLRAERELVDFAYNPHVRSKVEYIKAPMDPWDQPDWFQRDYQTGSNAEIAYRFFIMCCKPAIIKTLRGISNAQGSCIIHCHAGKDRTGILSAIIALVTENDRYSIEQDYLASESDTQKSLLNIVIDHINETGGIENYLRDAGMDIEEITDLRQKLMYDEK